MFAFGALLVTLFAGENDWTAIFSICFVMKTLVLIGFYWFYLFFIGFVNKKTVFIGFPCVLIGFYWFSLIL